MIFVENLCFLCRNIFSTQRQTLFTMFLRKTWLFLFVILTTIVCASVAQDSVDCFASAITHRCYLTTKTPYRFVANANDSALEYSDCAPRKIWMILRHGTRYPGKKWTARMRNELPKIRNSIVKSNAQGLGMLGERNVELLRNWQTSFSDKDVVKLAAEGERELVGIAERYQSRFPSLMPEIYSNRTYADSESHSDSANGDRDYDIPLILCSALQFKYTATQRAEESAKHFALGLLGRKQARDVWYPKPEYRDPVLRFYKRCKRWREEIDKNPESVKEKEKFVESSTFQEMLNDVSKRVGFALDYESVNLIYNICAFETAWNEKKDSPWCSILSVDNFKVLEFAHDLKYYWIDGYAHSLTYEQACTAMRDMFEFFESENETKTIAYFTHSGTILKLLALLGVARDETHLRHDSFSPDRNRAWRTSLIDAFASNIAFVSYDCKIQGPSILVMHQERVVQLAGCPVDAPCPLSTMKNKYPDTEFECPFEDMCAT